MIWLYLICLVALLLCLYWKWDEGQFSRRGIKTLPSSFPMLGMMVDALRQKEHPMESLTRIYKMFPDERYFGMKQMNVSVIVLRDPELIKLVGIKDFDHFPDHLLTISEDADDMFGKSILSLTGEKWRDMRATLSPAFTSSKMRNMFQFVVEIGMQAADYFEQQAKVDEFNERGLVEVEMKDIFTRYTNDVITTTAFGVRINSLVDKNNDLYLIGKDVSSFQGWRFVKMLFFVFFPKLMKALNQQLFSDRIKNTFRRLVLDAMDYRQENNVVRQDMIHLLMEAKKGSLKHDSGDGPDDAGFAAVDESQLGRRAIKKQWTDDELVAQVVVFYMAGFETTSTLLCFMAHELAVNPEVQRRLQEEVDEVAVDEEGHPNYSDLIKMPYMDMVVTETLRKWPPLVNTERKCSKAYNLPPPSKERTQEFTVKLGESVMIPICAIHHDPKYFPDPERFDPERFSEENKKNVHPFSYLPFGIGPRNCIGSRFALMEAKSVIFSLLKRFEFVKTAKTRDPIKLSPKTFHLVSENGFWIGLKPRY